MPLGVSAFVRLITKRLRRDLAEAVVSNNGRHCEGGGPRAH